MSVLQLTVAPVWITTDCPKLKAFKLVTPLRVWVPENVRAPVDARKLLDTPEDMIPVPLIFSGARKLDTETELLADIVPLLTNVPAVTSRPLMLIEPEFVNVVAASVTEPPLSEEISRASTSLMIMTPVLVAFKVVAAVFSAMLPLPPLTVNVDEALMTPLPFMVPPGADRLTLVP